MVALRSVPFSGGYITNIAGFEFPTGTTTRKTPRRFSRAKRKLRDPVNVYPCGILEEAYRQLMAESVPLVKSESKSETALILDAYSRWKQLERMWVDAWQSQTNAPKIDTAA